MVLCAPSLPVCRFVSFFSSGLSRVKWGGGYSAGEQCKLLPVESKPQTLSDKSKLSHIIFLNNLSFLIKIDISFFRR